VVVTIINLLVHNPHQALVIIVVEEAVINIINHRHRLTTVVISLYLRRVMVLISLYLRRVMVLISLYLRRVMVLISHNYLQIMAAISLSLHHTMVAISLHIRIRDLPQQLFVSVAE
jgi:hypothetical protein